jgi:hypothetical protein
LGIATSFACFGVAVFPRPAPCQTLEVLFAEANGYVLYTMMSLKTAAAVPVSRSSEHRRQDHERNDVNGHGNQYEHSQRDNGDNRDTPKAAGALNSVVSLASMRLGIPGGDHD